MHALTNQPRLSESTEGEETAAERACGRRLQRNTTEHHLRTFISLPSVLSSLRAAPLFLFLFLSVRICNSEFPLLSTLFPLPPSPGV
jgi:hypothetical protein